MPAFDPVTVDNWFVYHAPSGDQVERYQRVRDLARELAYGIARECGDTPDSRAAMQLLRQAVMMANASIACHGTGASG